jgi:thiol:disulfide interchange protein
MMIPRILVAAALLPAFLAVGQANAASSADVSAALNVSALRPGAPAMLAVVVNVHPGLHVQSHQPLDPSLIAFELKTDSNPAVGFLSPIYPPPQLQTYAALGQLSVYTDQFIVYLPVTVKDAAAPGPVTLSGRLTLQACTESSCFPPEHPKFSVTTNIVAASAAVQPVNAELFASAPTTAPAPAPAPQPAMPAVTIASGQTTISFFGLEVDLSEHSGLLVALVAFAAGIIFNIVPCVLPVLPVKAIGFYEASKHSRARSLLLGLVFSLGLVAVFATLGMLVLLSKSLFGTQVAWGQEFANPWFVWPLTVVLAALGFGMMGAFSARLPTSLYGLDFRHDTIGGNFLWGGLTAILSAPCTAPLFPPVLFYAATLSRVEGFLLVTTVGCGMASPYLLLSAFPEVARRFPRTGAVSELVKQMMGFLLLGTAAFFAGQRLVGEPKQWWFVFAVVACASLYLVVRTPRVSKSVGAICFAMALAIAMSAGALLLTLRLTAPDAVDWKPYTPEVLADARAAGRPVLVDFTADWCLNCKYVELTVFRDRRTVDAIGAMNVLTLKADLSNDDAVGWPLERQLTSNGIPFTAIYLPRVEQPVGLASIYTTDTLLGVLNRGQSGGK